MSEIIRRDLVAWTPFGLVATANGATELGKGARESREAASAQGVSDSPSTVADTDDDLDRGLAEWKAKQRG